MMATRAEEVQQLPGAGEHVLRGAADTRWRLLPFLGPAFIACVAYIDPGNFATNIAGGSKYGFTLVWVIVAANLMAMLIQSLSAKPGFAGGESVLLAVGILGATVMPHVIYLHSALTQNRIRPTSDDDARRIFRF